MQKIWEIDGIDSKTPIYIGSGLFFQTQANLLSELELEFAKFAVSGSNTNLTSFLGGGIGTEGWSYYFEVYGSGGTTQSFDAILGHALGAAIPASPHRILGLRLLQEPIEQSPLWRSVKKLRV